VRGLRSISSSRFELRDEIETLGLRGGREERREASIRARNSSPQPNGVSERVERSVLGSNNKDYRRQISKDGGTVGTKRTFQGCR